MKRVSKVVLPAVLAVCAATGLGAQSKGAPVSRPAPTAPTNPSSSPPVYTNSGPFRGNNGPYLTPDLESMSEQDQLRLEQRQRLERALRAEQQKRIVSDTSQLLELTAMYQHNLQDHGELTDADRKLLARIEKLARDVKSRASGY